MYFLGSNGKDYMFLLKGHEDLRQDERVMQLFGLVNTLLLHDPDTFRRNLTIQVSLNKFATSISVDVLRIVQNFNRIICLEIRCDSIIHKQWINRLGTILRYASHSY